ncbi:hypothetical protein JOF53_005914 [Crossiella equi]|uniref:Uncharacterized protein n=1 Tax=Crossiella equi TaxID=130796 RepID=A0ABS5AKY2_9PSEU|nr:DUF5336 domain-containing protein [Crossiella equi]MBP2477042.1 hypothetical protein [Crossiella equi]
MTNPQAEQPQPYSQQDAPAPKKKSKLPKILGYLIVPLIALGFFVYNFMFGAGNAKVGECLAGDGTNANSVEKVDCADAKAKFTVVGRVEGKTSADVDDVEGKEHACDAYPGWKHVYWEQSSRRSTTGALLCLVPKA